MVSPSRVSAYVFGLMPQTFLNPSIPPPLVLIDGTALMFRAFYAMPSLTRRVPERIEGQPEEQEIGAVVGFCNILLSQLQPPPPVLACPYAPTVVVAFDCAGPTFRDDLFGEYKAQRSEPPPTLGPQFDLAYEACQAFGWTAVSAPGFEADDIIATFAAAAGRGVGTGGSSGAGAKRGVVIVGQDKDFMQLVTDRCVLVDPARKRMFGTAEVEEKFGVPPRLMVDLQALAGDPTDNIPGVPGIGPKIAAELLRSWGSLGSVLDAAQAMDPSNPKKPAIKQTKRRENLVAHRDDALLSRRLVTLNSQVPLERIRLYETGDDAGADSDLLLENEGRLARLLAPLPRARDQVGADPASVPLSSAVEFCRRNQMRALEKAVRSKAVP